MPLLVTHSPWLYWFLAALCLVGLYTVCYFILSRTFCELWIRRTSSVKAQGYIFGPSKISVPATVFLLLSLLVYATAAYLGQVGYAFAWYAILAAIDIFSSPLGLFHSDPTGAPRPLPPPVQTEILYIDLVTDALIAVSAVGATYLFLNAVVLV
jgi:hypothetical protein